MSSEGEVGWKGAVEKGLASGQTDVAIEHWSH
jgi:hypothetical protein